MKKASKINLVLLALALSASGLYAQQGFGTKTPNKAAVIDMSSTNKGMLAPRIALTGTTNFAPISGITSANQHTANSLLVYNTATVGDVTPGYYYWLKPTALASGKWVRIIDVPADVRLVGTNSHISQDAGVGGNGTAMPGNDNIAIGAGAMNAATAVGAPAPYGLMANVAIGGGNQLAKVNGAGSVAIGYGNLSNATTGTNLAIGALNLVKATEAGSNVVVGSTSMSEVTTASSNISIGISNLNALTEGSNNYVIGNLSLNAITNQTQNLAIGAGVLPTAFGNKNIGVGSTVLNALGTGNDNVGLGVASGGALTTGSYNTFFGTEAGNRLSALSTERYTGGDFSLFLGSQTKAKNGVSNQLNIGNWIYGESGSIALGNFTGSTVLPTITPATRLDVVTGNVVVRAGTLAVGATSIPAIIVGATTINPKLHVVGDISTTGKVWTNSSVYADYVFEKYFNGNSNINPNYEFKSLNYVKEFIKTNHHLPGVESIDDLAKTENGYTFDITKLTVQSLEKIEELYLHTIEQQEKIDTQQFEINQLKKESEETKSRLEKLERLLQKNT